VTRKLVVALALLGTWACDKAPKPNAEPQPAAPRQIASVAVKDPHAEHDCSEAHPSAPRPAPATATALSEAGRAKLTTLRVSAHQGSVIVRKGEAGWTIAGPVACTVAEGRIERALDNLTSLQAEHSAEQPEQFELQIVLLKEEERVLHFDVAHRSHGTDLVQLNDGSRFRISGLDRELWSPDPAVWCVSER
jgi:hypothetical protein